MKAIITTMLLLSIFINVEGQSIRKNHLEMIPEERDAFVQLCYDEQQLIDDLGIYHSANFSSIHFMYRKNPPTPELDVFLAWHRRMIIELEHKIQEHCPCFSVSFWDWRADNSTSSSLWSNNFLGQFNGNWGLNRNLGTNGALPTSTNVTNVQSISNWDSYTSTLESSVVHTGPHGWVGGVMNSGASPRDPVFYLHHGMIDKLWQEWTEAGNATNYVKTDMPRYDGAYLRYDNVILPSVNPNSISNSDDLGVFFAEN